MINIHAIKGNYKNGFMVFGHADYAERGQDIVCAGVSAIIQTTLIGLSYYASISMEKESGKVIAEVLHKTDASFMFIDTMRKAIKEIAIQYPQNVQIWEELRNDEDDTGI